MNPKENCNSFISRKKEQIWAEKWESRKGDIKNVDYPLPFDEKKTAEGILYELYTNWANMS